MTLKFIVLLSTLLLFTGCVQQPTAWESKTTIQRKIETPSGDWYGEIDYTYGSDGKLQHFTYAFQTFTGHDPKTGDFKPTSCVRRYDVTEKGGLVLVSKVTTDSQTGAAVDRTFYEPEFTHWMTLAEAPKERNRDFQSRLQPPR
ncbi:MAG: hypothetical protein V4727_11715 [Verrucomicrobiota bacterium]